MRVLAAALLLALPAAADETAEAKGLRITQENDAKNSGYKSASGEMAMLLVNAHGDEVTRKMTFQGREVAGDGDRSLIEFLIPADVKGTRMLTWSHKKDQDDQWLFLPAFKRVKRISARSRTGSFMGSEFAYEDLGSQEVEKYAHKWLKDEALDGRKTWVLERVPVGKSGYTRQVAWVDQEYGSPLKIDFYDRKGELLKTMTFADYKKLDRWWRVHRIDVVNHQTRKKSTLTWSNQKLGQTFDDDAFDSESLADD